MTKQKKMSSCRDKIEQLKYPLVAIAEDTNLSTLSNPDLQRYFHEIGQYELLSHEETDELAVRFREKGDPDAAYRLVSANLRLVVKVAMKFQKHWMQNFMDLVQEGNIGLVKATKKFDPYRGVKFSYYAAFWIRAYVLKFIMDNSRLVKIGTTQAQRKLFFSLNKEKKLLEAEGFTVEPKLLAQRLNVKASEVSEMSQRMGRGDVSLETPIYSDSGDEQKSLILAHGPGIEAIVAGKEMKQKLSDLLHTLKGDLNVKENMILDKRLLKDDPLTLQKIADCFDISRERVRQIEMNLLKKMKRIFEQEMPDVTDFFDRDTFVV